MAEKVLIMGESGTGKSTSMRNCKPEELAIVNPVGKPLPFRGHFETLDSETDSQKIAHWVYRQTQAGKKMIVLDDFQYILSVPYMNRIKEQGWDKWNDFGANYFELIEMCKDLPADVIVYYMTHTEQLDSGITTVKLIGKMLREKITIEGMFTTVLRTCVSEGKYYFLTQNSGKDTVKSPLGMFSSYAIDNDLKYVDDKMRSYYEIGEHKTDAEMKTADASAAGELEKPDSNGRRARHTGSSEQPARRTHDEVVASNDEKKADYVEKTTKAVEDAAAGKDEVPWSEAVKEIDKIKEPVLDAVPRRTRAERKNTLDDCKVVKNVKCNFEEHKKTAVGLGITCEVDCCDVCAKKHECGAACNQALYGKQGGTTNTDSESIILAEDTYFHTADDNFIKKHKGDVVKLIDGGKEVMKKITKEEFDAGAKMIAASQPEAPVRERRKREIKPEGNADISTAMNPPEQADSNDAPAESQEAPIRHRRIRNV